MDTFENIQEFSVRDLSGRTLRIETYLDDDDGILTTVGFDLGAGDIFVFSIFCEEYDGTYGPN